MREVKINGLALDMTTNSPVIILAPLDSEELLLPIWIGHFEAWAIGMELSGLSSNRPLTHDLLKSSIESLGGKILKVEVTKLVNQTFYATIYVEMDSTIKEIDARPSDSIALALKAKVKIYVADELFQMKKGDGKTPGVTDAESLRERLRRINPEDFGRYSL
ncbi:MAG: bifunctional nuclease family protein [candidate division Zixibacteria bacterium]|nr:bifunctional nuclease family protein [candidate division Zixibacteria bacterium]